MLLQKMMSLFEHVSHFLRAQGPLSPLSPALVCIFFVPQGALSEPEEPMSEVEEMGGSFTNLRSYENH